MPDGGTLTISTRLVTGGSIRPRLADTQFDQYVEVGVSDTGVGMDATTRERIFEPFFTTKERGKGTGLGLAVVFGIMKTHDGFINVQSGPGEGTTFSLCFPVKLPGVQHLLEDRDKEEVTGGTETILVVEDEEMLAELLQTVLTANGYRVLIALDGEAAIATYQSHKDEISLVLTDLGLPKLSGTDVLERLKSINPFLKFLVTSGFIEPQEKSTLLELGADDIIPKPYVTNAVLQRIRALLDAA